MDKWNVDELIKAYEFVSLASSVSLVDDDFIKKNRVSVVHDGGNEMFFNIKFLTPDGRSRILTVRLCNGHRDEFIDLVKRVISLKIREEKKKLKKITQKIHDEL